jgi:hypothetical protein
MSVAGFIVPGSYASGPIRVKHFTKQRGALDQFLQEDLNGLVDYTFHISYVGGGLVIKLNDLYAEGVG